MLRDVAERVVNSDDPDIQRQVDRILEARRRQKRRFKNWIVAPNVSAPWSSQQRL